MTQTSTDYVKKMYKELKQLKEDLVDEASKQEDRMSKIEGMLERITENIGQANASLVKQTKPKKARKPPKKDVGETECTIKYNLNSDNQKRDDVSYITHSTNDEFKAFAKSIGVKWNLTAKGYAIPAEHVEGIVAQIESKFPKWTLTDERTDEHEMATAKPVITDAENDSGSESD